MKDDKAAIAFIGVHRDDDLFKELGSSAAWALVKHHFSLISECAASNGGRQIKQITMNKALCSFPDADSALNATLELYAQRPQIPKEIPISAGLDIGPVLKEAGDVFGQTVNSAARILDIARGNQILLSRTFFESVSNEGVTTFRDYGLFEAKGLDEPVDLIEATLDDDDVTTIGVPVAAKKRTGVKLRYKDRIAVVRGNVEFTLGRGEDADLKVNESNASRVHARVINRNGKFVLSDQSVNGTFITIGQAETRLHRLEFLPLHGSGEISLGKPAEESDHTIRFQCFEED